MEYVFWALYLLPLAICLWWLGGATARILSACWSGRDYEEGVILFAAAVFMMFCPFVNIAVAIMCVLAWRESSSIKGPHE